MIQRFDPEPACNWRHHGLRLAGAAIAVIVGLLWIAPGGPLSAQEAAEDAVDLSAVWSVDVARPNEQVVLAVVIQVEPGFHIGNTAELIPADKKELTMPTEIQLAATERTGSMAKIEKPVFPQTQKAAQIAGRTIVYVPVKLSKQVLPGQLDFDLFVKFQACDDTLCFAPHTFRKKLSLKVVSIDSIGQGCPEPELFVRWSDRRAGKPSNRTTGADYKSKEPPIGPPWVRDLVTAQKLALRSGRPIFLYSTKTFCPHCVVVESEMLSSPELQPHYDKAVWLYVYRDFNGSEQDRKAQRIGDRFSLSSWPQLWLVDPHTLETIRSTDRTVDSFAKAVAGIEIQPSEDFAEVERLKKSEARVIAFDQTPTLESAVRLSQSDDIVAKLAGVRYLVEQDQLSEVSGRASELLAIPNDSLRYEVLKAIAATGECDAIENVAQLVEKPRPSRNYNVLRLHAINALAASGDASAIDVIAPHAQATARNSTTRAAVEALVKLASRDADCRDDVVAALAKSFPPVEKGMERLVGRHARMVHEHLLKLTGREVAFPIAYDHQQRAELVRAWSQQTQDSNEQPDFAPVIQRLAQAVEYEVKQKDLPAFSMAIVDGDDVVWSNGYGFQDDEKKVPATAETIYRVGSISKLLTDISVMKLVESGQLDLDAPVTTYLPDFKPDNDSGTSITLRMLMTHRSGLVRESPVGNYFDPDEPSLAETVASLDGTPIIYPPGTRTKYSNAAIAVVGAVLESKLDGRHADLVQQEIFEPLNMSSSSFDRTPEIDSRLAEAYMWTYDDRRFTAPRFLLGTGPAGNLYSSVLDLSRFISLVLNDGRTARGPVVQPETMRMMTSAQVGADGKPQDFGIGFHIRELDGEKVVGHGGAVYGFSTQLEIIPARKIGVAAASALDGSNGVATRLSYYALRLLIAHQDGKPLPDYPRTAPVERRRARELVGQYREADGNRLANITELNGKVYLERGTYRYELRADEQDGSLLTDDVLGYGTRVEVSDSKSIKIGDAQYRRVPDAPPSKIPDRWKGLIGEYGWDHNTLYILERGGKLYALIEWFYYYPLTEVNENRFEFPDFGLYHGEGLQFERDENGRATQVIAAEVTFPRREVGTRDGETFKITPVKPVDQLRTAALAARPPAERGEFRNPELVDLTSLDPTIKLDVRYATTNNFMGAVFYQQPRALMQRPAAEAVARANARLKQRGLGLLVHDAYRPWHVTKMFWDATPSEMKDFVANPALGSRHNRGCAVDITLYDLKTGQPIQMVAGYDEFSARSFPMYPGGTSNQRWHRELLRRTMELEDFTVYEYEWWHFDYQDWQRYRIGNSTFEEVESN